MRQIDELADPKEQRRGICKGGRKGKVEETPADGEELHALPPPDDYEAIALVIQQHRRRSPPLSGADTARLTTAWKKTEKLARHPASRLQRWLLLSHPIDLTAQQQQQRLSILIETGSRAGNVAAGTGSDHHHDQLGPGTTNHSLRDMK